MAKNNFFAKLAYLFKKNFVMSYEYNRIITEHNINRLLIVCPILAFFGFANFFVTVFTQMDILYSHFHNLLYYGCIFISNFICYFWIRILKNNPSLGGRARNIPTYVVCVILLLLNLYDIYSTPDNINCILVFVAISMGATVLVDLKPIVYCPLILISTIATINKFYTSGDAYTVHYLNIILIGLILGIINLLLWRSKKIELREKMESEQREKILFDEIELASQVQSSFLSAEVPPSDSWNVGFYTQASEGVSGDLYDFYKKDNMLNGIGIFDISGHGLSAGLITMLAKNIIQQDVTSSPDSNLEDILMSINDKFIECKGPIENYLTGILLRIKNSRELEFVSAGHPLPIVYSHKTNTSDFFTNSLEERYGVIGLSDYPVKYVTEKLEFESNDEIILYTDGITECMNENGENFGKGRLLESVQAHINEPVEEQAKSIVNDLNNFVQGEALTDDITFVILKKK